MAESRSAKRQIEQTRLLIVEGRDEEFLFAAMLEQHLARQDIQVMGIGGKTRLADNLRALVKAPGFSSVEAIAIVRDADKTPGDSSVPAARSAWDSVIAALNGVDLPVPSTHGAFSPGTPRTAVFILPDGEHDGMLETLCLRAVADSRDAWPCVERYFRCLEEKGIRQKNPDKARAHAYLASCEEPDRRVGEAGQAGYWPWDAAAFAPVVELLRGL